MKITRTSYDGQANPINIAAARSWFAAKPNRIKKFRSHNLPTNPGGAASEPKMKAKLVVQEKTDAQE